jgi:hypothetical protein
VNFILGKMLVGRKPCLQTIHWPQTTRRDRGSRRRRKNLKSKISAKLNGDHRFDNTKSEKDTTAIATIVSPRLGITQYQDAGCATEKETDTLYLGECVAVPIPYFSTSFGTFFPGSCAAAECTMDFCGSGDCSGPVSGTYPVDYASCLFDGSFFSVMLSCPSCTY